MFSPAFQSLLPRSTPTHSQRQAEGAGWSARHCSTAPGHRLPMRLPPWRGLSTYNTRSQLCGYGATSASTVVPSAATPTFTCTTCGMGPAPGAALNLARVHRAARQCAGTARREGMGATSPLALVYTTDPAAQAAVTPTASASAGHTHRFTSRPFCSHRSCTHFFSRGDTWRSWLWHLQHFCAGVECVSIPRVRKRVARGAQEGGPVVRTRTHTANAREIAGVGRVVPPGTSSTRQCTTPSCGAPGTPK
jgi:hypothetical protein